MRVSNPWQSWNDDPVSSCLGECEVQEHCCQGWRQRGAGRRQFRNPYEGHAELGQPDHCLGQSPRNWCLEKPDDAFCNVLYLKREINKSGLVAKGSAAPAGSTYGDRQFREFREPRQMTASELLIRCVQLTTSTNQSQGIHPGQKGTRRGE